MPNMPKGYCESSAPGPVHEGEVSIQEVYGWLSSGRLTREQLKSVRFRCPQDNCPGRIVPVIYKKKPERCHFREHQSHPHRPDCRYKLLYDEAPSPRKATKSDYNPSSLVSENIVDISGLFARPMASIVVPPTGTKKADGGPPVGTRRPVAHYRVRAGRTLNEMDHLVEYLDTLQVHRQSWAKRYLRGLPGAKGPVPLAVAVVTAATPLESLEKAKGQERFVFGRVVEAKVRLDQRGEKETHLILERDDTQAELNLLVHRDFYDTIRPGHVVLIRGKLLNWRTPPHVFYFATNRLDMVAPRRYKADDGHRLLSEEERRIDDYLHSLKQRFGIVHDVPGRQSLKWSTSECRKQFQGYRPDWILTVLGRSTWLPVIVEYFGFAQKVGWAPAERYAESRIEKRAFYTNLAGFRYVELDRPHDGDFEAMLERELAPYIKEALTPEPKPEPPAEIVEWAAPPTPTYTVVAEVAPALPPVEAVSPPLPSPVPEAPPTLAKKAVALLRRFLSWKS